MGEDRQTMKKKELEAIAQAAAKNIKTEADLNEFRQMLNWTIILVSINTSSPTLTIAATAIPAIPCKPKKVSSS